MLFEVASLSTDGCFRLEWRDTADGREWFEVVETECNFPKPPDVTLDTEG